MKKYRPKKWFGFARLFLTLLVIVTFDRGSNIVIDHIATQSNTESKKLSQVVILDNKEEIYIEENPALQRYISLPEKGFNVTLNNRKYNLSNDEYDFFVAVVASESARDKDDALAVMSVILNRADIYGISPVDVVKRPGQFAGYLDGCYLIYLNSDGSLAEFTKKDEIVQAVNDGLSGVRNNNYFSFRSWQSDQYSDNYITYRGNRYR